LTRARFLFLLTENVKIALSTGKIGHRQPMDDLPDSVFFIADSLRFRVIGPFLPAGEEYESGVPVMYHRNPPLTSMVECRYLMDFIPLGLGGQVYSIPWAYAAQRMGVDPLVWTNLRQTEFADFSIDRLVDAMVEIASDPDQEIEAYQFDFSASASRPEDIEAVKSYWRERSDQAQEAWESSEEGMIDILFGGDKDVYSNWLESTDC